MDSKAAELIKNGEYNKACKIADEYTDNFEYDEAEEILNEIYDVVTDEYGIGSEEAIRCLIKIAKINKERHNLDYALSLFNTALEWCEQNGFAYSLTYADILTETADIFCLYDRLNEAYDMFCKAYDICVEESGEHSTGACYILRKFSDCCEQLGRYDEAICSYDRLIEIYESEDSEPSSDLAFAYSGLAYAYRKKGQFNKSKLIYEKAVDIIKITDGEGSANYLDITNDLCGIYSRLKMHDKALPLRKYILAQAKKVFGEDHYNTGIAESNLADAYNEIGDYKKAEELFRKCYDRAKANLGENHLETVRNLRVLSEVLSSAGKYNEAFKGMQKVYLHNCEALGEKNPTTIDNAESLAFCYAGKEEYGIAKEMLENLIRMSHDKYYDCARHFYLCEGYIYICAKSGDYSKALSLSEKLEQYAKSLPEPVINVLDESRAIAYSGLGELDKALDCQINYCKIEKENYFENHPCILRAQHGLARILFEKEEYTEAMKICHSLSNIYDVCCQCEPDRLANDILTAELLTSVGKPDLAASILDTVIKSIDKEQYRSLYANALFALAENDISSNNRKDALEKSKQALDIRKSIYKSGGKDVDRSTAQYREITRLIGKEETNETV